MKKIQKILVANRGEIVLRVKQTCDQLGIQVVSVFAEDDKDLPHALLEESYSLGSGSLAETYLNQDKMISIAKKSNCDAIHPGYGFLSENASFCARVKKEELIFIGPREDSILLMGDKVQSKITATKYDLPLIPGFHGEDQGSSNLKKQATKIEMPLLIKASAGGGGKGMRIVRALDEFESALESVKREAKNAFGNDSVLLEKLIESPRHIEVQVLSDSHGNHRHIFERECSAQRRYQKVIEEAPACNLKQETRDKLYKASLDLVSGINYLGAGTIEYIVDSQENIYFLEMNTRLQVEHPVSEQISGVDLVEWQIRIAQGEAITFDQLTNPTHHSIECRLYAEDTDKGFLPTTGNIIETANPIFPDTRFDSGYQSGNTVGINYDPMLAKLIVTAKSKDECIEKLLIELEELSFSGLKTNRDFLIQLLQNDLFKKSLIHTKYIEENSEMFQSVSKETIARILATEFLVDISEKTFSWSNPWVNQEGEWL